MRIDRINASDLTIHKKAMDIQDVDSSLISAAPQVDGDEREMLREQMNQMMGNAMMIPAKIAGAEGSGLYDLRMENAAIIRKAARELVVGFRGLQIFGWKEPRDLHLLRIDRIAGCDRQNHIIDRWGLFDPPGVGPFDKDPDDDIPFDPEALLGKDDDDPDA